VTTGKQLIEEGRKQGLQEGIAQGIAQARQRFRAKVLRALRQRFGDAVQPYIEQRVAAASNEQLEIWLSRLVMGATLEEAFAD